MNWKTVIGVGFRRYWFYNVYFITLLAFDDKTIISNAKFIILLSLIAGIIGFVF
jgi:NhaA family Na+:H+ antiporter